MSTTIILTSLLRTLWELDFSPFTEVSSIQRSLNTLQYYTVTQNGVLIREVSTNQRFVIERSHCNTINIFVTSETFNIHFYKQGFSNLL